MTSRSQDYSKGRDRKLSFEIDALCDAFEEIWVAGDTPQIEIFLERAPGDDRVLLLRELVAIELWWRRQRGNRPTPSEYLARFPADASALQDLLTDADVTIKGPSEDASQSPPLAGYERSTPHAVVTPFRGNPGSSRHGRFLPGSHFSTRYRIAGLLGRGGMGEVYLADDLKLGHPVAIKLLPEHLGRDELLRELLRNEVRLARQITHPNVCRVHDLEETDGLLFMTMEFIEGEDLATLLRRIGRMPLEKGMQVARELCLGLLAAHEQGVIHRDLKPANVMIDLRGRVKISDFGLAAVWEDVSSGKREFAGTPRYAAPEQLLRGEVTVQSDLYALGAIIYEMFVGQSVCPTSKFAETLAWHRSGAQFKFASHWATVGPGVCGMIERCLSPEPISRPESALDVASAFADADPVRAAQALGEVPSPDDLAEAGLRRPLSRQSLTICLVGIAVLCLAMAGLSRLTLSTQLDPEQSPAALVYRSRQVLDTIRRVGPPGDAPVSQDRAWGYAAHSDVRGPVYFWYRQSASLLTPRFFVPDLNRPMNISRGVVTWDDPPLDAPGMTLTWLDGQGALRGYRTMATWQESQRTPVIDDGQWREALSELTRIDLRHYERETLAAPSPVPADRWEQLNPPANRDGTEQPAVEVAYLDQQLVYLRVLDNPATLSRNLDWLGVPQERQLGSLSVFFFAIMLGWGGWICWSQLHTQRIDRLAVARLSGGVLLISFIAWLLRAKHVPAIEEAAILQTGLARSLITAGIVGLWYAAIESSLRRQVPDSMIGLAKLLRWEVRNPHVGRDVLAGVIGGLLIAVISEFVTALTATGICGDLRRMPSPLNYMLSTRLLAASLFDSVERAVLLSLGAALLLLVTRWFFVRRSWSIAAFILCLTAMFAAARGGTPLAWGSALLIAGVAAVIVERFGLLATAVTLITRIALLFPMSGGMGAWFAESSMYAWCLVFGLVAFSLHAMTYKRGLY